MDKIKEIADYIETKRKTKNILWRLVIMLKDIAWFFHYHSSYLFILLYKRKKNFKKHKEAKHFYKISFCITSMDRLCHIQKTLIKNIKHNLSYPNVEFVLLDYGSTDGLKDWVYKNCEEYLEKGILKYHRLDGPTKFHMAHAKNTAHLLATGDVLCGLDADNFTNKNFAYYINFEYNKNNYIVGHPPFMQIGDFGGRIFVSKENFKKLEGYDEEFDGWGYEDLDFKFRAFDIGLQAVKIPVFFLRCIKHSDHMRDKNMNIPKTISTEVNKRLFSEKRENAKKK